MTREVIALPEDADLAEAGRLLLERRIKSIPVVRGRRVVGIVARRDLLEVLARRDQDIAGELEALLPAELGAPSPYRVTVRDGIVGLTGSADPTTRRLASLLAREVPGVIEDRFGEEWGDGHLPRGSGERWGPAGRLDGARAAVPARRRP